VNDGKNILVADAMYEVAVYNIDDPYIPMRGPRISNPGTWDLFSGLVLSEDNTKLFIATSSTGLLAYEITNLSTF